MNHCKGLILAVSPVFKYATQILILLSVYLEIQYKTGLKFIGIFAFFFFFNLSIFFLAVNTTVSYTLELMVSG